MIGSSDGSSWVMFVAVMELVLALAVVGAAAVEVPVQTAPVAMRAATQSCLA